MAPGIATSFSTAWAAVSTEGLQQYTGHLGIQFTDPVQSPSWLTAGLAGTLTAGLDVGGQVDPTQSGCRVASVQQKASWHVDFRLTAGWRAGVTADGLQEADLMWAGAGQADSTAAALVVGADGGGRAGGDTATAGNTASHGVGSVVLLG